MPPDQLATVVEFARDKPLHFHVSEQRAENEACLAATGRTPVQLLAEHGALGPDSTAIHATHLAPTDDLGETTICMCPTTERDLADGIGNAGPRLALGSDSHAIIDLFEEARAVELNLRLKTERRGHFTARALLEAATNHACLGWDDAGRIAPGFRADLITLDLSLAAPGDSPNPTRCSSRSCSRPPPRTSPEPSSDADHQHRHARHE